MDVNFLLRQTYSQSAATYDQIIEILKSRNLLIEDEAEAINTLQRIGYYRFKGYSRHWLAKTSDQNMIYSSSTSFGKIEKLCLFDCELRQFLLYAISNIEITLRAILANEMAHAFGPVGYLDSRNFTCQEDHWRFLDEIEKELSRTHDKFDNFQNGLIPIWAIIEIMNFGTLSLLYKNLQFSIQEKIAQQYFRLPKNYLGGNSSIILEKWLHCLTVYRNICAHNGRLYDRVSVISPKLHYKYDAKGSTIDRSRLFAIFIVLKEISPSEIVWTRFLSFVIELFSRSNGIIDLKHYGMPVNWLDVLRL